MKNSFASLRAELTVLLKHKILLIATCIILLIPCLYAGMFIWSYWNPYDKVNKLPIAVVIEDTGTTMNGTDIHIGKDLGKELKKNADLDIRVVSEKAAEKGLKHNDYYMLLRIPKDFSKKAMSALDDHKEKAQLIYIPNEGYNYTAASIGESAMEKVKEEVANQITDAYVKALLQAQQELGNGLDRLSEGGKKVQTGVQSADKGAGDLHKGIADLMAGTVQFTAGNKQISHGISASHKGASQLSSGANALNNGLGQLQQGAQPLVKGAQTLSEKAQQLSQSINQVFQGTTSIYNQVEEGSKQTQTGAQQLTNGIEQFSNQVKGTSQYIQSTSDNMSKQLASMEARIQNNPSLTDEDKKQMLTEINTLSEENAQLKAHTVPATTVDQTTGALKKGIAALTGGQTNLLTGLDQLTSGEQSLVTNAQVFAKSQGELAKGMHSFQQGLTSAKSGAAKLADGSQSLASGLGRLNNGTAMLSQSSAALVDGAAQAQDGSSRLKTGLDALNNGSSDLASALSHVDTQVNENAFKAESSAKQISSPVALAEKPFNHVKEYGPAFAPYFLSLGLYVGMFLFCSAFPLTTAFGARTGISWFFGKLGVVMTVSIFQALILDGLVFLMDIPVDSILKFLLFSILTSWAFGSILLFINAALGTVGRFVTMGVLILQLTAGAGSFPLEMLPRFFQIIHPYLPMTYTISGFKSLISATQSSSLGQDTLMLTLFFFIGAVLSLGFFIARFRKNDQMKADHPKTTHA
ncbi:hypothetical protein GCM10011391_23580 [Pullulanibacillus camelliae]|uniref:ABC-2 type transporter transmembrane domain-containing protein n=1 Tax=Pullulanibacillus camelliae TaxID=1707096 RepID=A0A8J2YHX2_9BACL|nr:YhgE/Pip domain-containing protein [Pullulanibacillus camelliae]GGE44072.1 hypothetical protein GCM10011391_23580 [Pullulanibacillus camelliae]